MLLGAARSEEDLLDRVHADGPRVLGVHELKELVQGRPPLALGAVMLDAPFL